VPIDFTLSESQREIQANASAFAEGFLAPVAAKVDRIIDPWEAFVATREAYREKAHAGFTKPVFPAALLSATTPVCRLNFGVGVGKRHKQDQRVENLATKAFCVEPVGQVWAGFFNGKSCEEVTPDTTTFPKRSTANP